MTKQQDGFSFVLVLIVILVLGVVGGTGYYLMEHRSTKSDNSNNQVQKDYTVTVPTEWKEIDTGLGFSVFAPVGWAKDSHFTSTSNGVKSESYRLDEAGNTSDNGVLVTADHLPTASKAAYESYIKGFTESIRNAYDGTAAHTTTAITINNKPWYQTNLITPATDNQKEYHYRTLYYWTGSFVISISNDAKSASELTQVSNNYLYKIAASLKVAK